jgi:hypothetical protein
MFKSNYDYGEGLFQNLDKYKSVMDFRKARMKKRKKILDKLKKASLAVDQEFENINDQDSYNESNWYGGYYDNINPESDNIAKLDHSNETPNEKTNKITNDHLFGDEEIEINPFLGSFNIFDK